MTPGARYVVNTPRLGPLARRLVYAIGLVLLISGAAWLALHTWVRIPGAFGPEHHPAEVWLMRLHGLGALPALAGLGALMARHVGPGWRVQRRRTSGLGVLAVSGVLALGGWGLYYVAGDTARQWLAVSHWLLGLALPGLVLWHVIGARRERRAEEGTARQRPGL